MQNLITFRFALPVIVIVAIVTLAIIVFALLAGTHAGNAYGFPG